MDLNALIDGLAQDSHEAGQSAYGNVANALGQSFAGYAGNHSGAQNAGAALWNMGMTQYPAGAAAQNPQNFPAFGANYPSLGDYADPVKNKQMAHDRALSMMNQYVREKYEPVFQLMGIKLTAPWVPPVSIGAHPCEWKMEIDLDGNAYRHVWDMLDDSPAEWDAEVGYLIDKVARIRKSALPPQDAGEPELVLGDVSGPARGSVAGGSGRRGPAVVDPGETHAQPVGQSA